MLINITNITPVQLARPIRRASVARSVRGARGAPGALARAALRQGAALPLHVRQPAARAAATLRLSAGLL